MHLGEFLSVLFRSWRERGWMDPGRCFIGVVRRADAGLKRPRPTENTDCKTLSEVQKTGVVVDYIH